MIRQLLKALGREKERNYINRTWSPRRLDGYQTWNCKWTLSIQVTAEWWEILLLRGWTPADRLCTGHITLCATVLSIVCDFYINVFFHIWNLMYMKLNFLPLCWINTSIGDFFLLLRCTQILCKCPCVHLNVCLIWLSLMFNWYKCCCVNTGEDNIV